MGTCLMDIENQRGIALVVVLWITVLLTVMAGVFSSVVRSEARGVANFMSQTKAYYMATGGVNAAIAGIIEESGKAAASAPAVAEEEQERWTADGRPREVMLDGGSVKVRVFDEGGKLDVNKATRQDLVRVFIALGVKGAERDTIIDSILDWIDANNFHRLSGAEDSYYKELTEPYGATDGPISAVEELLWVKGVTPEVFYGAVAEGTDNQAAGERSFGLADVFTVYTGSVRVNVNTASVGVLMSLPGVDRKAAEAIVQRRESSLIQDFSVLASITRGLDPGVTNYVTFASPGIFTIEATAELDSSPMTHTVRAVVAAKKDSLKVLYWKDRTYKEGKEN